MDIVVALEKKHQVSIPCSVELLVLYIALCVKNTLRLRRFKNVLTVGSKMSITLDSGRLFAITVTNLFRRS